MNELWIYDIIGQDFWGEGIAPTQVRDTLAGFDKSQPVLVRINSPGGSVFDAVAIMSILKEWKAGVDVQVDGIAASAASYIAMAGRTLKMADGAVLMIHEPWSGVVGNAADMRKEAELLERIGNQLATAYATRSGQPLNDVLLAMAEETWYTALEAVQAGYADEILFGTDPAAYSVPSHFGFRKQPSSKQAPDMAAQAASRRRNIAALRKVLTHRTASW